MSENVYYSKYCLVPHCQSTSKRYPDKLFLTLPRDTKRRKLWLKAMRRHLSELSEKTTGYVCADHFILEEDMKNYMKYKFMGGRIYLKNHVVPHIFDCQKDEKRKLSTERNAFKKRARKELWKPLQVEKVDEERPTSSSADLLENDITEGCSTVEDLQGNSNLSKMSPSVLKKKFLCSKHFSKEQTCHRRLPLDAVPARHTSKGSTPLEIKNSIELRLKRVLKTSVKKNTAILQHQLEDEQESKEKMHIVENVVNPDYKNDEVKLENMDFEEEFHHPSEIDLKMKYENVNVKLESDRNEEQFDNSTYIPIKIEENPQNEVNIDSLHTVVDIENVKLDPYEIEDQFIDRKVLHRKLFLVDHDNTTANFNTLNLEEEIKEVKLEPEDIEEQFFEHIDFIIKSRRRR